MGWYYRGADFWGFGFRFGFFGVEILSKGISRLGVDVGFLGLGFGWKDLGAWIFNVGIFDGVLDIVFYRV